MKLAKRLKRKLGNQSGQGMTEYILLIVIVLAIATVFRDPITRAVQSKVDQVGTSISDFQ